MDYLIALFETSIESPDKDQTVTWHRDGKQSEENKMLGKV